MRVLLLLPVLALALAAAAPPPAASTAPASSPVADPQAAPAAASPAPPAAAERSILNPKADSGRNDVFGRAQPVRPMVGGDEPIGPEADLSKPATACPATRPKACSLDYLPVCANDAGTPPQRRTLGSACKACRDPNVTGYVTGRCPAPAAAEAGG